MILVCVSAEMNTGEFAVEKAAYFFKVLMSYNLAKAKTRSTASIVILDYSVATGTHRPSRTTSRQAARALFSCNLDFRNPILDNEDLQVIDRIRATVDIGSS